MLCRDVEAVVEQEGLEPLPAAARAHVAGCTRCQAFVADLSAIVDVAKKWPTEVEPPGHVWVALRTQLELEGVIREPVPVPLAEAAPWWHSLAQLFRSRGLATALVGLVIALAAVWQVQVRDLTRNTGSPDPIFSTAAALNEQEHDVSNMQLATTSPVDTSLRQSLKQLDEFIAECELRVRQEPHDELAREYLAAAYQQKAQLLSALLDRARSVN
jgi:hypothetical protein